MWTAAMQFLFCEYINGIFVAVNRCQLQTYVPVSKYKQFYIVTLQGIMSSCINKKMNEKPLF